jgi:hypothetical protein
MTTRCTHSSAFPRRDTPEFASGSIAQNRGRRESRVRRAHPQPRVRSEKAHERSHHGHTGSPGIPRASGFNGFLRDLGDRAFLPPSSLRSLLLKNLTPASGRQDHTTSPSASSAFRLAASRRPPHPAPNVRDDRETPLISRRDDRNMDLIWVRRETEYFFGKDWTGGIALNGFMKFDFARNIGNQPPSPLARGRRKEWHPTPAARP